MSHPFVVAVTGASGAVYARRLLEMLLGAGRDVHLTISPAGRDVLQHELDVAVDLQSFRAADFKFRGPADLSGRLTYHHYQDFLSPLASGSFLTAGMVICPCSVGTLSAVAQGSSANLVQRAADVHLKERRKLILVPRETPLSVVHLENMQRACQAGAVVLPAAPGWYHGAESLDDLVNFVVARILDQLGVPHNLMRRWGSA